MGRTVKAKVGNAVEFTDESEPVDQSQAVPVIEPDPEPVAPPAPRATPPQYATGAVKQDPASLAVAIRTNIPDPDSSYDWGVMTVDRGGHYAAWEEVAGWRDLA